MNQSTQIARTFLLASLAIFTFASLTFAQLPQPVAMAYEDPPVLDASTMLRPEFLQGPHFQVRGSVPTYAGQNQYTIDSDFGVFDADGNTQLVTRVQEIAAIARLSDVSRTDEYKSALKKAAQSPVQLARNLATNPVKTITGVPAGIWKFMNRAGQAVKEAGEQHERSPYEDSAGTDLIGFSKTKRAIALQLGVDPYSSNETLQKELNGIAWAAFAGNMTFKLALAPVGGAAGSVITGVGIAGSTQAALRDKSPSDIRRLGLGELEDMNVSREDAEAFLNTTAYSPTNQILLIDALQQLHGVGGRNRFIRQASQATNETDAIFYRRCAQVVAKVQQGTQLDYIGSLDGLPVCLARNGTAIVPLEWDYACFTQASARFIQRLKAATFGDRKITGYRIVLTGVVSPRAKQQLSLDNVTLTEKALPGPLQ